METMEQCNRRIRIQNSATAEVKDAFEACHYGCMGWDNLEFEQRAYARKLARDGLILLNPFSATEKAQAIVAKALEG